MRTPLNRAKRVREGCLHWSEQAWLRSHAIASRSEYDGAGVTEDTQIVVDAGERRGRRAAAFGQRGQARSQARTDSHVRIFYVKIQYPHIFYIASHFTDFTE